MEAALELDDDVFFADISRQISLLIMDDEDDASSLDSQYYPTAANLQRFANTFPPPLQSSYLRYDHNHQQQTCKGTGVFIPRSSNQRRQGKPTKASANKSLRPYYDQSLRGLIVPRANYDINGSPSLEQSLNDVRKRRF